LSGERGRDTGGALNPPGNYVLICNQPAHYLLGMHIAFTVK